jgi:hypothetical protein
MSGEYTSATRDLGAPLSQQLSRVIPQTRCVGSAEHPGSWLRAAALLQRIQKGESQVTACLEKASDSFSLPTSPTSGHCCPIQDKHDRDRLATITEASQI